MLAVVEAKNFLHVARWVGRVRLHVEVSTYCAQQIDAGDGTLQVPDQVLTKGLPFTIEPGKTLPICPQCRTAVLASMGA